MALNIILKCVNFPILASFDLISKMIGDKTLSSGVVYYPTPLQAQLAEVIEYINCISAED